MQTPVATTETWSLAASGRYGSGVKIDLFVSPASFQLTFGSSWSCTASETPLAEVSRDTLWW